MYYLCKEKYLLKSRFPAIEFIFDKTVSAPEITLDTDKKCTRIKYSLACHYHQLSDYIEIKSRYPEGNIGGRRSFADVPAISPEGKLKDVLVIHAKDVYGIEREYKAEGTSYTQTDKGYVDIGSCPADFVHNLAEYWPQIYPESLVVLSQHPDNPQVLRITAKQPGEAGNGITYEFYSRDSAAAPEPLEFPAEVPDIEGARSHSGAISLVSPDGKIYTRLDIIYGSSVYSIAGSNRTNYNFRYINMGKSAADFAANIAQHWGSMFPDSPVDISVPESDASAIQAVAKQPGARYDSVLYRVYRSAPSAAIPLSGGEDPLSPIPVLESPDDVIGLIVPGTYILYNEIVVNGFHMVLSDATRGLAMRQYTIKNIDTVYLDQNSLNEQVLTILTPKSPLLSLYINRINECEEVYIRKYDRDFSFSQFSILQTVKANRINIRAAAMVPVLKERLLVESSDYIAALIKQLQSKYPEIQFYNYAPDIRESNYGEFIFYRAFPEQLSSPILTTPVMSDPIYGDVMRTTCQVQFEYQTHDLLRYNKRRFDFLINRFISNNTVASLTVPTTSHKFTFSVIWNREEAASDVMLQKQQQLTEASKFKLTFRFIATLTVTIYRLNNHYPVNVQTIVNQYEGPNSKSRLLARVVNDYSHQGDFKHGKRTTC